MNPLVSVIIPTYNSSSVLARAVDSVLSQNYPNIEIIIIDDCSSDGTTELVTRKYSSDKRVNYSRLEKNSGPAYARNKALGLSKGEFIAFLDADDEWLPGKLINQVNLILQHPEIDLIFTDVENIDYQRGIIRKYSDINKIFLRSLFLSRITADNGLYLVNGEVKRELYRGNFICISSVLVKKSCLLSISGFDNSCFGTEDLDLWVRLADKFKFYYWKELSVRYNWMATSISRISEPRLKELLRYHKAALQSPDYSDLNELALNNLYLNYKVLILTYSKKWNVIKAWQTYIESRDYPLKDGLWMYALASILGPIPLYVKLYFMNPISKSLLSIKSPINS